MQNVSVSLDSVEYLTISSRQHTDKDVDYPTIPPAGGDHLGIWHNCGIYTKTLLDEAAVHSLEHGAIWVTYRSDIGVDNILYLTQLLQDFEKILVSPHPDQSSSIVATAWGRRIELDKPNDLRLVAFIEKFLDASSAPEAGVTCRNGIGRPPADPYSR